MPADARRWYLRIWFAGGAGGQAVGPLPLPAGISSFAGLPAPVELKWKDAPSLVAGPWGASGVAGLVYHIWECLYVGG